METLKEVCPCTDECLNYLTKFCKELKGYTKEIIELPESNPQIIDLSNVEGVEMMVSLDEKHWCVDNIVAKCKNKFINSDGDYWNFAKPIEPIKQVTTQEVEQGKPEAKPEGVTEEGKQEEVNKFVIEPNERTSWSKNGKQYKVGDVIDGNQLDELSGDLVGNAPNERFVLVQEPLSKFDDNRESLLFQEKGYEQEEIDRLESMKANFDQTPPIPQEGDGMHRIVVAKELGNKTILMWKNIKNVAPSLSKEVTPAQQVEQLKELNG